MRYVISDIHGEYELFVELLNKIKFAPQDTLFVCGDIIDKGSNSIKLAQMISRMPNAHCIVGNHEYEFLKYYRSIMQQSPTDFELVLTQLQQYFPNDECLLDWELVDWLDTLPFYIEADEFICVHAGVPLDEQGRVLPLEQALPQQLVYDRDFKDGGVVVKDSKCVFFGHTPTSFVTNRDSEILAYLRPQSNGNSIADYYKIHLDLGSYISGKLGCFCVETCQCIYVKK